METKQNNFGIFSVRFFQGALIGLGAVLPGISGGVLCVVFGIYKTIMSFFSRPIETFRQQYTVLLPIILGGGFGFVVVAKLLGFLLENYPNPSLCLFIGLIIGMLPSLFKEAGEKGRSTSSFLAMFLAFVFILALLYVLDLVHLKIVPNFAWNIFCGVCIALSVIVPGLSFSTLLMPLGLYTPLVSGIGSFDWHILLPSGIGAVLTVILLAKAMNRLIEQYYSLTFHAIIGIVIAATIVIIPFQSFTVSPASCCLNLICLIGGVSVALALDGLNRRVKKRAES